VAVLFGALTRLPAQAACHKFAIAMYAIIDLETTGGNVKFDRITEIAIVLHDGKDIVGEFSTLVQPGVHIPYRITSITGITNDMVASAPHFYEVAKQVVEMTEGCTFVAHNVRFDYGFLREEFKSLGFDYVREVLCTIELSRGLVPGLRSYALAPLVDQLGLEPRPKHRALDDARATAALFSHLLRRREETKMPTLLTRKRGSMNPEINLHQDQINALPQKPGVYYFYDEWQQLIYIGKSVNIRSRVLSHFGNNTTARALEMKQQISHIRCAETGSELIALLKESEEIKRHTPRFNRAQRRSRFYYGLFTSIDTWGYITFRTERLRRNGLEPVTAFGTAREAKNFLEYIVEQHQLCQQKCHLHRLGGPCFHHSIHKCKGACCGMEDAESYNERASLLLGRLQYRQPNFLIVDKGRHDEECSIVLIENGKYKGYGFVEKEFLPSEPRLLGRCVEAFMDTKDVRQIIQLYLRQNKAEDVIVF
jgi:DNA polymerase III subunit epsilon